MPRWLPLATAGLLAILAVIGVGMWKFDTLREARVENGGRPEIPACDPAKGTGNALSPDCPGTAFPPARTP
ncbi:hypothetical protein G3T14_12220 [Methylobacterium sp. BTF04]|nr:hypothetical protein [Methylobacterium sp. BTF04]